MKYDIMNELDKELNTNLQIVDSNEGERDSLSSNKEVGRSPSLELTDNYQATEDELIKYLAEILVEGFLWQVKNASHTKQQKSSNIL